MVGVRHRRRAGSVVVYHDRDASAVAAAACGRRRVQFGAAHGARGVVAEPRVDARRVERVAADGEQAHRVARGELRQADRALGVPRRGRLVRLLEPPHRGERGEDRGVETGRLVRRMRVRRGVGAGAGAGAGRGVGTTGGAEAAPAAQPEGEEVEEVAQEEDGEEAEEEHEEDEHGQQHRERLPRRWPRRERDTRRTWPWGRRGRASAVVGAMVVGAIAEEAARGRGHEHDRVHGRMGRGRSSGADAFSGSWCSARERALVGAASSVCSSGWRSRGLYGEAKATPGRHDTDMYRACTGTARRMAPAGRWRRDATCRGRGRGRRAT